MYELDFIELGDMVLGDGIIVITRKGIHLGIEEVSTLRQARWADLLSKVPPEFRGGE